MSVCTSDDGSAADNDAKNIKKIVKRIRIDFSFSYCSEHVGGSAQEGYL